MEARLTEHAPMSPGCCFLCRQSTGPFLEFLISDVQVATHEGPRVIEGTVYLCVGGYQNPGCLAQAIEQAGGASPWKLAALGQAAVERIGDLEEELAITRAELGQARSREGVRVVPVDELLAQLSGERPDALAAPDLRRLPEAPPEAPLLPPAPPHPDSIAARLASGAGLAGAHGEFEGRLGATVSLE